MRRSLKIDWFRFARLQAERFWSKIVVLGKDECWLWTGGKDKDGYGKFAITAPRALVHASAPIQNGCSTLRSTVFIPVTRLHA
jgi:hypothetical protein